MLLAAAVLGCGYGICLVFGLAEVARLARPDDLAGLTAVFQVASYIGFAVPYLLSILRPDASAPSWRARVTASGMAIPTGWAAPGSMPHGH